MLRHIMLTLVFCVATAPVAAQAGPYRLPANDTLKYREISNGEVVIETPQGELTTRTEHDAGLRVVASSAGQARAWYASLRVRSVGPTGDLAPNTEGVLGLPYQLTYPSDGRVTLVDAPEFPTPIAAVTDLTHQFFDFFVSMPAGQPLRGQSWQDTLRSTVANPPMTSLLNEAIRTFRVRGDTVLVGRSALVVEVTTNSRMEGSGPLEGQPLTAVTSLEGVETGIAIFDWASGRLLHRSKSGNLRGLFRIEGAPQVIELPQTYQYTSTIEIER